MQEFHWTPGTNPKIKIALREVMLDQIRVRIFFGDPETGKDDCQDFRTIGYVRAKYGMLALFLQTKSKLGIPLDSHRVVKITDTTANEILYEHPSYDYGNWKVGKLPNGNYAAMRNELTHATFEYKEQAEAYIRFVTGEQNSTCTTPKVNFYNPNALVNAKKGQIR